MSSSDPDSKIDILDEPQVVSKKIRKAFTAPRATVGDGLFAFAEFVLLPAASLKGRKELVADRSRDGLEPLIYSSMDKMREDYENDILTPQLLKGLVTESLNGILSSIQAKFQASKEWQEITLKAYPPPEKPKKVKKEKKIGTGYPGQTKLVDRSKPDQPTPDKVEQKS